MKSRSLFPAEPRVDGGTLQAMAPDVKGLNAADSRLRSAQEDHLRRMSDEAGSIGIRS